MNSEEIKQKAKIYDRIVAPNENIKTDKQKADYIYGLEYASGEFTVTGVAKLLGLGPRGLYQYLADKGWIYRDANNRWKSSPSCKSQGLLQLSSQVRIIPKGLTRLATEIGDV